MNNLRIVERYDQGAWKLVPNGLQDIREGDTFRMFEEPGKPVIHNNYGAFIAVDKPCLTRGVWGVNVEFTHAA